MKRRLAWAKKYQNWTTDDWRRVVFSDETKVNVWGSDGCKYYWSRPEDPLKPHHIDVTVKHGGGSLMMWGCMTHEGPGTVLNCAGISRTIARHTTPKHHTPSSSFDSKVKMKRLQFVPGLLQKYLQPSEPQTLTLVSSENTTRLQSSSVQSLRALAHLV
ncbi:hypothetical protein G6F20_012964 [Rhizopus arrhizus]|nr:hypothetical protein G6F20_012964 [Rhizopus arrhizus]